MASSSCFCKRNLGELSLCWCFLYTELLDCVVFCHAVTSVGQDPSFWRMCATVCHPNTLRPTLLFPAYGIPVHIWCFASWELQCAF